MSETAGAGDEPEAIGEDGERWEPPHAGTPDGSKSKERKTTGPAKEKVLLVHVRDLMLSAAPAALVQGLVPARGITVVWGPHKSGKSFWVFDLACHVALGRPYHGRRVKKGPVVYCAFEGAAGYPARYEAWQQEFITEEGEIPDLYIELLRLDIVKDHQVFIDAVKKKVGNPVLVVLDTLNRSIPGSDSDDEQMRAYVTAAEAIATAYQCAVIIVHHSGWNAERMRGSTVLPGAMEAEIGVRRNSSGHVVVELRDARDMGTDAAFAYSLEQVEVGRDGDDEPITSCVLRTLDSPPDHRRGLKKSPKPKRQTPSDRIALRALAEAVAADGAAIGSSYIPSSARAVKIDLWREYAIKMGISGANNRDSQATTFRRSVERLSADCQVGIWEPYAWLP